MRWGELLRGGLQDDGTVDLDNPSAIPVTSDLSLQELEELVAQATQEEHHDGLAVFLFRLARELRDVRRQLEDVAAAGRARR